MLGYTQEPEPEEATVGKQFNDNIEYSVNAAGGREPQQEKYVNPQDEAAKKIQAGYRGYQVRKQGEPQTGVHDDGRHYIDENDTEVIDAVTKIQAGIRGYQTRKHVRGKEVSGYGVQMGNHTAHIGPEAKHLDSLNEHEAQAASRIQAGVRGYQARKEGKTKAEAATKIQAGVRGYKTRKDVKAKAEAATKIQASIRGYKTRKEINAQAEAATKIQAGIRGYKTRKDVKSKADAATKIQAGIRGYKTRKDVKSKADAATKIQAGIRGYKTRKDINAQNQAATKIQAGIRGYTARKAARSAADEENRFENEENANIENDSSESNTYTRDPETEAAASKIQAGIRGYQTRKDMREKSQAATKIQAGFRGHQTRKQVNPDVKLGHQDRVPPGTMAVAAEAGADPSNPEVNALGGVRKTQTRQHIEDGPVKLVSFRIDGTLVLFFFCMCRFCSLFQLRMYTVVLYRPVESNSDRFFIH